MNRVILLLEYVTAVVQGRLVAIALCLCLAAAFLLLPLWLPLFVCAPEALSDALDDAILWVERYRDLHIRRLVEIRSALKDGDAAEM